MVSSIFAGVFTVLLRKYKWLEIAPRHRRDIPTIKNTRITVEDILEALANGWSITEVAENFRIPIEAVREALRYALEVLNELRG